MKRRLTTRKVSLRWLLVIPALLLIAQIVEIATNVETASGFYTKPRTAYHLLLILAVILSACVVSMTLRNKKPLPSGQLMTGGAGFILCASAGAVTAYGCFLKLWEIARVHPFHHFFMTAEQLAQLGFKYSRFQIDFVWAILGFVVAGWFFTIAASAMRHGYISTNRYFALAPVLWYCIRAMARYITAPINANDSVTVTSVASLLVLGWTWLYIARYLCFLETSTVLRYAAGCSFAALCFTVSMAAPNLVVHVSRGEYADAVLLAADAVAAICAAYIADRMILTAKENNKDVQQQKID